MKKNRKPLIALVLVAIIGVVGGTIAYFSNYAVFENIFHTDKFEQEIEEKFVSPSDWRPGDTTEKKLEVTNTGTRPVKVGVLVHQEWESGNGNELSSTRLFGPRMDLVYGEDFVGMYEDDGEVCPANMTKLSMKDFGDIYDTVVPYIVKTPDFVCLSTDVYNKVQPAAILNLSNESDWTPYYEWGYGYVGEGNGTHAGVYNEDTGNFEYIEAEGGKYARRDALYLKENGLFVYNKELGAGETTTSFLDSVTFNPYAVADDRWDDGLVCDTYYVMEDGTEVLKPVKIGKSNTNAQGLDEIDMSKVVGQKSKCHSTGDGYSGATYTLSFLVYITQPEAFDDFVESVLPTLERNACDIFESECPE